MITLMNWKERTEDFNLGDCKALIKRYTKFCIENDTDFAIQVLLYLNKQSDSDNHIDGQGFNKLDDKFLKSLANCYLQYGKLSEKQEESLKKSITKYCTQLLDDITDGKFVDNEYIRVRFYDEDELINLLDELEVINLVYQIKEEPEELARRILDLERLVYKFTKED